MLKKMRVALLAEETVAKKKKCDECIFNISCQFIDDCTGCSFEETCGNKCAMFSKQESITY